MMKKITRKLSRRRLLFVIPRAILIVGITTGTAFLLSKQKQPVYNSEHIATEQTPEMTKEQPTKEIADTPTATPEPVKQSDAATQQPSTPVTPEKSVYEKYGVDQSIAQKFEAYYPDYASYNKDLFVSNVATIVNVVGENNAARFIDTHARNTGLVGRGADGYAQAEKNSFLRLIIGAGGYSFNLSWEPWSTVL
jgi:outer membrane biosynthesis protein TonB